MNCCKEDATSKKVIAVIGSTGQQGGGLVKAILADPEGGFEARALTRDPTNVRVRDLESRVHAVFRVTHFSRCHIGYGRRAQEGWGGCCQV